MPSSNIYVQSMNNHYNRIHGNQPSIPKPVSSYRRSRSNSPPTSSSASSSLSHHSAFSRNNSKAYSALSNNYASKTSRVLNTSKAILDDNDDDYSDSINRNSSKAYAPLSNNYASKTSRILNTSKAILDDNDDDYSDSIKEHKYNVYKSLERLSTLPRSTIRANSEFNAERFQKPSRFDSNTLNKSGESFKNQNGKSRLSISPSKSNNTIKRDLLRVGNTQMKKSETNDSEHSVSNSTNSPLSAKIAEFLQRTDHISNEWKKVGGNKNKKIEETSEKLSKLLQPNSNKTAQGFINNAGQQTSEVKTTSSQSNSRLSNGNETRHLSKLSNYDTDSDDNRCVSRQTNNNTLSEMTEDFADEHSTAALASERLAMEASERNRLEKELIEAQTLNKKLQENSDKLEMEVLCLRTPDMNGVDHSDDGEEGVDADVYKKRYERVLRELEFTKHRLTQQHQDDLEQLMGLKKQMEKKISDAYEEVEEQRHVAAEWKRKVQKVNSEMNDVRLLLEEQSSRNNLLEKKQRKFDSEYQIIQDELRQERMNKDKALRDKELALGDKYTLEQNLSSLKLELELKDQKLNNVSRELEELTFSGNTEEEVAALKKKKHQLEAKLKDQEEELDDLAGQIQILEQAKLKIEMNLEQIRREHRKELAQKDEEIEEIRCSNVKKVKALENQLENEHEERTLLLRERHELERRLSDIEDRDRSSRISDADQLNRLKRDLKRTKALLKDAQTMHQQARQDNPNKMLVRQLRNQLEDAECARSIAIKARQSAENDLAEVNIQLEEVQKSKHELEEKLSAISREKSQLQCQLDENEEELAEVMKKYQASVQQLSLEQSNLQDQATRIAELEAETSSYKDQLTELNSKLESIETHGDPSSTLALKRLQLKCKELESKLEFEHTTRARMEVQINRLKENTDKIQSDYNALRNKESVANNETRKLQRIIRELKENVQVHETKEINEQMKRKELEKLVESSDLEIASLKNDLKLALQRIADLQTAIQGDLDDEDSDENSDEASDNRITVKFPQLQSSQHTKE